MSSSDHFLTFAASAPLFDPFRPITAASDPHCVLLIFSLIYLCKVSPSPRLPLLPPRSSPPLPLGLGLRRRRRTRLHRTTSLSYHRPRLKSLLHRIRPRASLLTSLNQQRSAHSNGWILKHLHPPEPDPRVFEDLRGLPRRFCDPPPSGSQIPSTTFHASHR
ncbi:hypothetical protein BJY01DRAFT_83581 [Aspergillus pseudoustus]|uniref:Uncharacterized protein n=1 Tax=Aspergillus pseudoustus TaxID=1810923 RepID=A0ABR4J3R9_9EURO